MTVLNGAQSRAQLGGRRVAVDQRRAGGRDRAAGGRRRRSPRPGRPRRSSAVRTRSTNAGPRLVVVVVVLAARPARGGQLEDPLEGAAVRGRSRRRRPRAARATTARWSNSFQPSSSSGATDQPAASAIAVAVSRCRFIAPCTTAPGSIPAAARNRPEHPALLDPGLAEHVVVVGTERRLPVPDQQHQPHQALRPASRGSATRGRRPPARSRHRPRCGSGRGSSGTRSAGRSPRAGTARTPRRSATAPGVTSSPVRLGVPVARPAAGSTSPAPWSAAGGSPGRTRRRRPGSSRRARRRGPSAGRRPWPSPSRGRRAPGGGRPGRGPCCRSASRCGSGTGRRRRAGARRATR